MEHQNLNPGRSKLFVPGGIGAAVVAGALGVVAAYGAVNPASIGGIRGAWDFFGLFLGWSIWWSLVGMVIYQGYRDITPDVIQIETDRVIGVYGRHFVGPRAGTQRIMPLSSITDLSEASYRGKGGHPGSVTARGLGLEGSEPGTPLQPIEERRVPSRDSLRFYVSDPNLAAIREAWEAWKAQR